MMPSLFTNWFQKKPEPHAVDWEAKYKKAITDLAAARDELASLKRAVENQRASIASFMPDALAMRRKRQMDRDRKAAKKEGV